MMKRLSEKTERLKIMLNYFNYLTFSLKDNPVLTSSVFLLLLSILPWLERFPSMEYFQL